MIFSLDSLSTNCSGKWTSTKTIYFIKEAKIYKYQENVNICHEMNKNIQKTQNQLIFDIKYITKIQRTYNQNHSIKLEYPKLYKNDKLANSSYSYNLIIISKYCIKCTLINNNIEYNEFIYSINANFTISIGILKKYNKYVSTIFTSYIKQI